MECIDGVVCMDNNREITSHQRGRVGSHTQTHDPLVAEAYGLDNPGWFRNSTVIFYINKQGGTRSIQLCRQAMRLLLMCQDNQIVLRSRHIPGRLNVLADILSRPTQISGRE